MRIFSPQADKSSGHKLLELVLGLGCLLIIAALAFPFFALSNHTHRTACISNLKQIVTAVLIYSSDNEDLVPPFFTFESATIEKSFFSSINVYSKNPKIYVCPLDQDQNTSHEYEPGREGIPGLNSYVHCFSLQGVIPKYSEGQRKLHCEIKNSELSKIPYMRDPVRGSIVKDGVSVLASPHGAQFSIAYLDGHSKVRNPVGIGTEL